MPPMRPMTRVISCPVCVVFMCTWFRNTKKPSIMTVYRPHRAMHDAPLSRDPHLGKPLHGNCCGPANSTSGAAKSDRRGVNEGRLSVWLDRNHCRRQQQNQPLPLLNMQTLVGRPDVRYTQRKTGPVQRPRAIYVSLIRLG